ncbi:MAG: S8 family serine peptidase [bacterium]|nr:S8 family serine peptidase [bacterium]
MARDMEAFRAIVDRPALNRWGRLFHLSAQDLESLRRTTERNMGRQASDLANYFWFEFEKGTRGEEIASEILKLASVEDAYLAPIPRDAQDIPPPTPNFQNTGNSRGFSQRYLRSAPLGIDAFYAWTKPGGSGAGMTVIDIESGWIVDHEDLPTMVYQDGRVNNGDGNHGTATMSVMVGGNNGYGVTGIAYDAEGGVGSVNRNYANIYFINVGDAIIQAMLALSAGDVIVIEQHAQLFFGEENCTTCITGTGMPSDSCGLIAMEYWHHIFDAIASASAAGVIVVEAAGNGQQNLDHERYDRRFDRNWRNSGAVLVGAGSSSFGGSANARSPKCFSNHGSRLDLQGWGEDVMAAGYGESGGALDIGLRPGGGDNRQWYRDDFSGTSSASPVVAGAVLAVQGVQSANGHPPLNWLEVRDLLRDTGQPQRGSDLIGPLPDLQAAIDRLEQDFPPPQQDAILSGATHFGRLLFSTTYERGSSPKLPYPSPATRAL